MVVGGSKVIAVMGTATSSNSYMCVCGSRFMLSCWPKWYIFADNRSGCLVTQYVCHGNGHAIMGALSGVLLSWLLSVCDNRSCCHGGPSGVFWLSTST